MGLLLERIEIENYRGLGSYSVDGLSSWTSITGSNSTSKSTIVSALSFLGSNKMHNYSDLPACFKPTKVPLKDISIRVRYLFKLTDSFLDLVSDERLLEVLILNYEGILQKQTKPEQDHYKSSLEMELHTIKAKPLKEIMVDALYDTIKGFQARRYDRTYYQAFSDAGGLSLKPIEEALQEAKYFRIEMELSHSDGPCFSFFLLDQSRQEIVSDDLFYHWLHETHSLDLIFFAFAIGAVFIKSVTGQPFHSEKSEIPRSILASDGSNLEDFIEYCLTCHSERINALSDSFERVFRRKIQLKKPEAGSQPDETRIVVKLSGIADWFPLERLSDGMLHALKILLQIESCQRGDILVLDEPELHLHPGAARALREIIASKKKDIQIVCATHSAAFIDPSYADCVLLQKVGELPQALQAKDIDTALTEIGSSGLDAILFDVVIWYEGPSDKLYIERWLHLFSQSIKSQQSQIGLLHFGGKGNLEHINPKTIKGIARKSLFVIDSDKKAEDDTTDDKTILFADECSKLGIPCWITKRRAIENYLPANVLKKVLHISDAGFQVTHYEDVIEKLRLLGQSKRKVPLARSAAQEITLEDITADEEFKDELKSKLLDVLDSFAST